MWRLVMGIGSCALAVLPACGGKFQTSESDPGPSAAGDAAAPSGSSAAADNPDADTELGTCKLGPLEYLEPNKPCAWVADNRCYDTRVMACNCACPRSHDSQCASGFGAGPDGHVWVACN